MTRIMPLLSDAGHTTAGESSCYTMPVTRGADLTPYTFDKDDRDAEAKTRQ